VDHALFHAPYNKLVQKAFARLTYHDLSRRALAGEPLGAEADEALGAAAADLGDGSHPRPPTQLPRELERAVVALAAREYDDKARAVSARGVCGVGVWAASLGVRGASACAASSSYCHVLGRGAALLRSARPCAPPTTTLTIRTLALKLTAQVRPSTCVQRATGNMYTASLWSGIAQLLETRGPGLVGRRVLLYSYGSGISAALLSLVGREVEGRFSLGRLQAQVRGLCAAC
jgi:3-hydroxy-3-methylglutaryl CoA synthase